MFKNMFKIMANQERQALKREWSTVFKLSQEAKVAFSDNKHKEAIALNQEIINISESLVYKGQHRDLYNNIALSYQRLGDTTNALVYRKILAEEYSSYENIVFYAEQLSLNGETMETLLQCKKAEDLRPDLTHFNKNTQPLPTQRDIAFALKLNDIKVFNIDRLFRENPSIKPVTHAP